MAYLDFTSVTQTSITVRIGGLDLTRQANKGTSRLPRHNTYRISCIGDIRTAATGSDGYSGEVSFTGLTPGTSYDFAGLVNYTEVNGGSNDAYIPDTCSTEEKPAPVRPSYFSWLRGLVSSRPSINELASGWDIPYYLNAAGWNSYTSNINDVREYRGLSRYSFTTAIAGRTELSAAMVNQAINAINAMSPPISPPSLTTSMSTPGSAALLNKLVDSLNSVT